MKDKIQNIDKEFVKSRFEKSLDSYDQNASVQNTMALDLIANLQNDLSQKEINIIFEIGCGTGFITRRMLENYTFEKYHINDLSPLFFEKIKPLITNYKNKVQFVPGDIEKLIKEVKFLPNLIISGAVFQWIENLNSLLSSCYNILAKDGIIAFTTFGLNNFKEIRAIENNKLIYYSLEELKTIASPNYEILFSREDSIVKKFESSSILLKHLRYTGVAGITKKIWTKKHFIRFTNLYQENFSDENNLLNLTYNPIYMILKKKG